MTPVCCAQQVDFKTNFDEQIRRPQPQQYTEQLRECTPIGDYLYMIIAGSEPSLFPYFPTACRVRIRWTMSSKIPVGAYRTKCLVQVIFHLFMDILFLITSVLKYCIQSCKFKFCKTTYPGPVWKKSHAGGSFQVQVTDSGSCVLINEVSIFSS